MNAHEFRATERVPGWCVRCGGARFTHPHPAYQCRPETCGGSGYDPCAAAVDAVAAPLPLHRTEAGYPNCSTCDGGGCLDCTDPA